MKYFLLISMSFLVQEVNNEISIYPNPATDHIIIEQENFYGKESLAILNALGERVFTSTLISGSQTINISDLLPGIYILRKEDFFLKFVKQ